MPTREKILERFGGDEEAMKAHYRTMQKKSRETYVKNGSKGGFNALTVEQRKEISRKALEKRWGKK